MSHRQPWLVADNAGIRTQVNVTTRPAEERRHIKLPWDQEPASRRLQVLFLDLEPSAQGAFGCSPLHLGLGPNVLSKWPPLGMCTR